MIQLLIREGNSTILIWFFYFLNYLRSYRINFIVSLGFCLCFYLTFGRPSGKFSLFFSLSSKPEQFSPRHSARPLSFPEATLFGLGKCSTGSNLNFHLCSGKVWLMYSVTMSVSVSCELERLSKYTLSHSILVFRCIFWMIFKVRCTAPFLYFFNFDCSICNK